MFEIYGVDVGRNGDTDTSCFFVNVSSQVSDGLGLQQDIRYRDVTLAKEREVIILSKQLDDVVAPAVKKAAR